MKGVSSMKLHRDLDLTQKTTWHMLHRIRAAFGEVDFKSAMSWKSNVEYFRLPPTLPFLQLSVVYRNISDLHIQMMMPDKYVNNMHTLAYLYGHLYKLQLAVT